MCLLRTLAPRQTRKTHHNHVRPVHRLPQQVQRRTTRPIAPVPVRPVLQQELHDGESGRGGGARGRVQRRRPLGVGLVDGRGRASKLEQRCEALGVAARGRVQEGAALRGGHGWGWKKGARKKEEGGRAPGAVRISEAFRGGGRGEK